MWMFGVLMQVESFFRWYIIMCHRWAPHNRIFELSTDGCCNIYCEKLCNEGTLPIVVHDVPGNRILLSVRLHTQVFFIFLKGMIFISDIYWKICFCGFTKNCSSMNSFSNSHCIATIKHLYIMLYSYFHVCMCVCFGGYHFYYCTRVYFFTNVLTRRKYERVNPVWNDFDLIGLNDANNNIEIYSLFQGRRIYVMPLSLLVKKKN